MIKPSRPTYAGSLTVISLFTGAMGLDLGLEMAGFKVKVALDIFHWACETIKANRPHIPVIERDIRKVSTKEVLEVAGLNAGETTVVTGGPPCQPFSTAGKRLSIQDVKERGGGDLVFEFIKAVREIRPKCFIFENVTGLLSAANQHMPFYERTRNRADKLSKEVQLGTAFEKVLEEFRETGYKIKWAVLDSADYGVAQRRKRLFIIGLSGDLEVLFPPPATHGALEDSEVSAGHKKPWLTLRDVIWDLRDNDNLESIQFPSWGKYLRYVSQGGCWVDIPEPLQKEAMGGAYDNGDDQLKRGKRGGRRGFFRRLSWNKPSPTLVTSPVMKGSCLCHPDHDRPLSVEEYMRLQSFPDHWKFVGPTQAKYRVIGEAVPPCLAHFIADAVKSAITGKG